MKLINVLNIGDIVKTKNGKFGIVEDILKNSTYPIHVKFEDEIQVYTENGYFYINIRDDRDIHKHNVFNDIHTKYAMIETDSVIKYRGFKFISKSTSKDKVYCSQIDIKFKNLINTLLDRIDTNKFNIEEKRTFISVYKDKKLIFNIKPKINNIKFKLKDKIIELNDDDLDNFLTNIK